MDKRKISKELSEHLRSVANLKGLKSISRDLNVPVRDFVKRFTAHGTVGYLPCNKDCLN